MVSRMQKIEEKKSKRQAIFFTFLTILLTLVVIFLGIPSLIKMAVFLSNLRSSGQSIETKDTVPPVPPRLQPLAEATQSAKVSLRGFSEPGATIKVFRDNEEISEVLVDKDGQFTVSDITLRVGENRFKTLAIDNAGNESKYSPIISISLDTTPPTLSLTTPTDGKTFYEDEKEILVAGQTETGAQLNINGFYALVDTEGNFAKKIVLEGGENEIKIVAIDNAGNKAEIITTVTYTP